MGDKKRKLVQNTTEAIEPEGKKAKHERSERHEKKEKRKPRDAEDMMEVDDAGPEKTEKEEKKEKKAKRKAKGERDDNEEQPTEKSNQPSTQSEPMKSDGPNTAEVEKKEKKKAKKEAQKAKKAAAAAEDENKPQEQSANGTSVPEKKQTRFIVFVGNLPFSANVESVTKHFEKNPPSEVRVATERNNPEKCRGFGFVEFENFDRMKSCLKSYHHSSFDDGKSPARRINVELTAGGGGRSDYRKDKIKAKNERLEGQRKRATEQLKQEKARKEEIQKNGDEDAFAGLHPSRRNRLG